MKPSTNMRTKSQKSENVIGEGPNWILVAGSALLGSLFIHLGHKLKQTLEARQPDSARLKGVYVYNYLTRLFPFLVIVIGSYRL